VCGEIFRLRTSPIACICIPAATRDGIFPCSSPDKMFREYRSRTGSAVDFAPKLNQTPGTPSRRIVAGCKTKGSAQINRSPLGFGAKAASQERNYNCLHCKSTLRHSRIPSSAWRLGHTRNSLARTARAGCPSICERPFVCGIISSATGRSRRSFDSQGICINVGNKQRVRAKRRCSQRRRQSHALTGGLAEAWEIDHSLATDLSFCGALMPRNERADCCLPRQLLSGRQSSSRRRNTAHLSQKA
jgi:hypothetical protein